MRTKLSLVGGRGVNLDQLPSELAPGVWSNMINFRSRAGFDELWEGAYLQYNTGAIKPLWGLPYSSSRRYAVYCSSTKMYAISGYNVNVNEITRYTDTVIISSMTASGTTVTVTTASPHGRTTGDAVDVWGVIPSTYNVDGATITVISPTAFTYMVATAPATSPATVAGAYSYNSTSNFPALADASHRYTGGAFNGLFIYNHPGAGLYYWGGVDYLVNETAFFLLDENGNRMTAGGNLRVRRVPGFYDTVTWNTAIAARPFKKYIVVLGQTKGGITHRQNVRWATSISDAFTLPTTFTSSSTNDAGETNLTETAGSVVDCLPFGEINIVFLTDARYAMQYIGGSDVFAFTRLPGNQGLLAPNCVVNTPLGQVFLTPEMDVMIHAGGEPKSIAADRVRQYLRDNIAPAYAATLSFLAVNPEKHEVMVCFAKNLGATTVCDTALAWNWIDDTWAKYDLTSNGTSASGLAFAANGLWPNLSTFENTESIGYFAFHSSDNTKTGMYYTVEGAAGRWFESDHTGTLERIGIDAGDRNYMKALHRSRWNIDAGAGDTVSIYHGSAKFADTAPTYASPVTYTVGTTDYCNARSTQGRFLAVKLLTSSIGSFLKVRSQDLDISTGGTR